MFLKVPRAIAPSQISTNSDRPFISLQQSDHIHQISKTAIAP
ncbi:hypothetical protein [Pseudanabaena sp. 'Roaring Creek']|nr:hypothetical protein [Pseudanabaena sp. 'Roaring Creek']